MSATDKPVDLESAREKLDALCAKVGLLRSEELPGADRRAPKGACMWTASYARLVLWPCTSSDPASIEEAAREGQEWFDDVLVHGEAQVRGQPIDGYLVLALPCAPGLEAREDVRRLELSSQVCRKHLIWPSLDTDINHEPGTWRRVADVTVLGLPDAETATGGELLWPEIDSEAQAVWDDLTQLGLTATLIQDEAP